MYNYTHEAIEIDHGDRDLSCAFRNERFEMGIGEDYLGAEGYVRWAEINLTIEEAQVFHDWLCEKLGMYEDNKC